MCTTVYKEYILQNTVFMSVISGTSDIRLRDMPRRERPELGKREEIRGGRNRYAVEL